MVNTQVLVGLYQLLHPPLKNFWVSPRQVPCLTSEVSRGTNAPENLTTTNPTSMNHTKASDDVRNSVSPEGSLKDSIPDVYYH